MENDRFNECSDINLRYEVGNMLQHKTNGYQSFEFALYNRDVRAAVKENQSHALLGDHWADVQVQDVRAHDEFEARTKIAERFPPDLGFVVEDLSASSY